MSTDEVSELEKALQQAKRRLEEATRRLQARHVGGEWDEFHAAFDAKLALERSLARSRGQEFADAIDWTPRWSGGAPCPHVVASGRKTYLLYLVDTTEPSWEGATVRVVNPAALRREKLALVTFERCHAHTFGAPNRDDDVHRLSGRGFAGYGAYRIESSHWLASEKHHDGSSDYWNGLHHYLLAFHDELFECIAATWSIEVVDTSFDEALQRLARLVLQR